MHEVKPEVGTGGNRILQGNLLLPCNHLPVDIPSKAKHKTERIDQKDKCITPPVEDLSDGTSSGHNLEKVVSEPSVVEKQPKPTLSEDAITDSGHQGEASSDNPALQEREEARSYNIDEQDPPIQNNNSQPGSSELEHRPQRQTLTNASYVQHTWKSHI